MIKLSPEMLMAILETLNVAVLLGDIRDHYIFDEDTLKFISVSNTNYELENNPVVGKTLIFGVCIETIWSINYIVYFNKAKIFRLFHVDQK